MSQFLSFGVRHHRYTPPESQTPAHARRVREIAAGANTQTWVLGSCHHMERIGAFLYVTNGRQTLLVDVANIDAWATFRDPEPEGRHDGVLAFIVGLCCGLVIAGLALMGLLRRL